jgi:ribonuclease VapC
MPLNQSEGATDRIGIVEAVAARRISAAALAEAGIVLQARYGDHGERELDVFVQRARIDIVPVREDHAEIARSGFRRFGKGRHRAGLNFGDCFSYALAIALGEPLLFVGTDVGLTDATAVVH